MRHGVGSAGIKTDPDFFLQDPATLSLDTEMVCQDPEKDPESWVVMQIQGYCRCIDFRTDKFPSELCLLQVRLPLQISAGQC